MNKIWMFCHISLLKVSDTIDDILFVDQSPIGGTWRSYPATYLKIYDRIRSLMASTDEARKRKLRYKLF